MRPAFACVAALLAATVLPGLAAEPGVTPQKVTVGMSTPLTGPLAHYGRELERGLRVGLGQANAAGGANGREVELLVRDDAGQPDRAVTNTRALLEGGVIALTGYHGAASIEAVLLLVEQSGVPLIGAASSAEVLREPPRRGVFNLRAGAREEAAAMVLQLDTVGLSEIAAIVQDDALGRAGLEGIQVELTRLALKPQAVEKLPQGATAPDISRATQAVCKQRPQALVLALDAQNALAVIRAARKAACLPQFYVMSEAGAQLVAGGASPGELAGVVVSQVVPHPGTAAAPAALDYRRLLGAAAPSYPGLEGFLYARVLVEGLRRCGREPSRRCLVAALEARPVDAGGYRVQFGANDRRGSKFVEMTIVTPDGRFRR
ncbi:ABC transporter substrate-binding protein [Caenimonas sedimenti]|uniref:ABC transporter substrate-binding protein n=1 Tax=Caenimonas sedimenti TaxID=2596921 RepID=A0A562ZWB3_9BURK|nr:ABC transporter substrate-binding protein [Caenimonas sedimenti]TWO72909.1 ABC transporter substrate-binding protein [Caenimonas sedimenti]